MKIYILCDLEGTAGIVDFKTQTYSDAKYYEQTKRLATLELNALIDGVLAGGATEVIVLDGHGPGGLDIELIHPEAKVLWGRPLSSTWELDASFDAMMLYGHHAMNNIPNGVLCHSWSSQTIANCWLNGDLIGEIGVNIGLAGYFGVPTVLISGDDAAVEEARQYVQNIEAVSVKRGLSRTSALTLAPQKARELLRAAGERVMGRIDEIAPVKFAPPHVFRTAYMDSRTADSRCAAPYIKRLDAWTIEVTADDFAELCRLK